MIAIDSSQWLIAITAHCEWLITMTHCNHYSFARSHHELYKSSLWSHHELYKSSLTLQSLLRANDSSQWLIAMTAHSHVVSHSNDSSRTTHHEFEWLITCEWYVDDCSTWQCDDLDSARNHVAQRVVYEIFVTHRVGAVSWLIIGCDYGGGGGNFSKVKRVVEMDSNTIKLVMSSRLKERVIHWCLVWCDVVMT